MFHYNNDNFTTATVVVNELHVEYKPTYSLFKSYPVKPSGNINIIKWNTIYVIKHNTYIEDDDKKNVRLLCFDQII